ncbi:MAG: hypothetical protein MK081_10790 [Flavobacteriales bacterium]|nr:hypothetical protein [Flavobacteriales bacterium]
MLRLLAACALFSIALPLSAQVMEEEPNDFITQAMDIGLNETVIASFSSAFEYDFYRVTLPEQGKINVDITNFDLEPHDLAIVNIAGNAPQYGGLVEALNNADPQTHIEKCCLAAGDYYIRVQGPFNANNDQYYVEMTFIPHDGPNDDAPHRTNETAHDATEISLEDEFILAGNIGFDQHLDGESRDRDDWFKVNMPSRGGIVLEEISSEAEYDATCASWNLSEPGVDVYLNEGNLGNGSGVPTDADLASCLSVEYFLIAVKDGGFSGINEYCQSYALPGELVLFPNEDDADNDTDDDIIENANEITLGEQDVFDGYIGYVRFEGIVVRDLKDFWKFEMPTNGPMQAIISFDEDFVDLQFFARDSNGNPLALGVSTSYFENEVQLDFECIEEGQEIYLEVKHSGGNCGPYQMTFNYGSAPTSPEGEFDSFEDAGTLNVGSTTQVGLGLETLNEENQVVSDDQDFYQLEIPSGRLRLNFTGIDEFPTTELYLQDLENDGDGPLSEPILIESDVIDEEENDIEWYCLGAGTYFVKFTTAGPFECGAFSVNPQMIDSAADADTEPEDPENPPSITTAVDGTLGYISYFITNDQGTTFASGDEKDTWLYQSTGPGDFFISLVSDDIESLEFKIYNSEGEDLTEVGSPAINGNTMEWLMTCLDSGEFRIEIDLAAGALCTAYTLSVEHGYEGDDESQDNDSIESAQ